jgi:hypothetical protein
VSLALGSCKARALTGTCRLLCGRLSVRQTDCAARQATGGLFLWGALRLSKK